MIVDQWSETQPHQGPQSESQPALGAFMRGIWIVCLGFSLVALVSCHKPQNMHLYVN